MDIGKRSFLFLLTILSLGSMLVGVIWFIKFSKDIGIDAPYMKYYYGVLGLSIFLGVSMLLGLIASVCGGPCSLQALGCVFITYDVILVGSVVGIILSRYKIENTIHGWWAYNVNSRGTDHIQDMFDCCGFYNSSDYPSNGCDSMLKGCATILFEKTTNLAIIIGCSFGISFILVTLATAIAFHMSYKQPEPENSLEA